MDFNKMKYLNVIWSAEKVGLCAVKFSKYIKNAI